MTVVREPPRAAAGIGPHATSGDVAWARVTRFDDDPHPGRPRILFIGHAESTHAHAWIDLLAGAGLNVRMFALPGGVPPDTWEVRTYVSTPTDQQLDTRTRRRLYPAGRLARAPKRAYARLVSSERAVEQHWLAQVIREWKPNIVHTLGLDPAGEFYFDTRKEYGLETMAAWVAQTRGGSDLALARFDESRATRLAAVLRASDCILSDNAVNFEIARDMGVRAEQLLGDPVEIPERIGSHEHHQPPPNGLFRQCSHPLIPITTGTGFFYHPRQAGASGTR